MQQSVYPRAGLASILVLGLRHGWIIPIPIRRAEVLRMKKVPFSAVQFLRDLLSLARGLPTRFGSPWTSKVLAVAGNAILHSFADFFKLLQV